MHFAVALSLLFFVPVHSGPLGSFKPAYPGGAAHSDQVEFYASVIAGAARAEKICEGYRTNVTVLAGVRAKMAIRVEDRPEVSRQVQQFERMVSDQIEHIGVASWCAAVLRIFGPNGSIVPGLLELRVRRRP
jgi:hypothetical protein